MAAAKKTTDHDQIREWVEEREGRPSIVGATRDGGRDGGGLRIDFGDHDEDLEEIEWDEFFEIFDENELTFAYRDETADGDVSRYNKFLSAD